MLVGSPGRQIKIGQLEFGFDSEFPWRHAAWMLCYGNIHSWINESEHFGSAELLIKVDAEFDKTWIPTGNPKKEVLLIRYLANRA